MFICLIQEEFNQHKYHKNNEFFIPPFEYFFVSTFHWYFKRIRVDIGQSSKAFFKLHSNHTTFQGSQGWLRSSGKFLELRKFSQTEFWDFWRERKRKKWLRNRSTSQTGFDAIYLKRTLQNRRQHHVYRGSQIETDRPRDNIDPRTALTRQIQYHFFHSMKEIYLHFTRLL